MKAIVAVAILVAVFAAPASAQSGQEPTQCGPQRDPLYRVSQVSALIAHGMDLATTADAMSRPGYREANPALRWASDTPLALGATKMALAAGSLLIAHELHRSGHRRWAIAVNFITTGLITAVAVQNARKVGR